MGSDRTVMGSYAVGETVLLTRFMGEDVDPPRPVTITKDQVQSLIYSYEVQAPRVRIFTDGYPNGIIHHDMRLYVKPEWIVPYHYVIDEVAETPWD